MSSIFGLFARKKMSKTVSSIADNIMAMDIGTASEAEIEAIQIRLAEYSDKLARSNQSYEKEQREAEFAEAAYNREYAIAQNLMQRVDAASDADKASLNSSLDAQMKKLQEMKPNVEREKTEAIQAKKLRDQYQEIVTTIGAKVRTRKAEIASAAASLDSARLRREQNEESLRAAQVRQGLASDDDSSVLGMLNRLSAKEQAAADSLSYQASAINPAPEPVDANIAAATAEVTGTATPTDPKDRLAALKL